MQPLYYLPGVTEAALFPQRSLAQSLLAARGLQRVAWDLTRRSQCSVCEVERGPDGGGRGLVLSFDNHLEPPALLGYYPDRQIWTQTAEGCWIGIAHGDRPTPAQLQRRDKLLAGHDVMLAAEAWHVPVIRFPTALAEGPQVTAWRTNLPQTMRWDPSGRFAPGVRDEWQWLWDLSGRMWQVIMEAEPDSSGNVYYELEEVADLALAALAANYRIDRGVQTALGLLDSSNWEEVLRAAIDWPLMARVLESQKKRADPQAPPGTSAPPGPPADCPSTVPAEPSCT